mgnify:CR=1 FL=1
MESKTKFMGHAPHPMLVVFPLGLFPIYYSLNQELSAKNDT